MTLVIESSSPTVAARGGAAALGLRASGLRGRGALVERERCAVCAEVVADTKGMGCTHLN